MAAQRETILGWARKTKALQEIVQTYRFERRQGAFSHMAHLAAAKAVERVDPSVDDAMSHAGVCIEWAEREVPRVVLALCAQSSGAVATCNLYEVPTRRGGHGRQLRRARSARARHPA